VLFLRVYATTATLGEVAEGLEQHGSARHVILAEGVRPGHALLTAEVHPESADPVLEFLVSHGIAEEDIALARLDEIAPVGSAHPATSLIWADVLGQASGTPDRSPSISHSRSRRASSPDSGSSRSTRS
jgi:hypothetical protein